MDDTVINDPTVFDGSPLGPMVLSSEGKTKMIYKLEERSNLVVKESIDIVTAQDGERKSEMPLKAKYSTDATVNCFRLLEAEGVQTDLVSRIDDTRILARNLDMIPVECVFRFSIGAKSSFRKRNPGLEEGDIELEEVVIEFFYKDDSLHDPIIVFENGKFSLHDPSMPVGENPLGFLPDDAMASFTGSLTGMFSILKDHTIVVAEVLRSAFAELGASLEDGKIEFGVDSEGRIRLGDVFDPDSCRLNYNGENLDKQGYRDEEEVTQELIDETTRKYRDFAFLTAQFNSQA